MAMAMGGMPGMGMGMTPPTQNQNFENIMRVIGLINTMQQNQQMMEYRVGRMDDSEKRQAQNDQITQLKNDMMLGQVYLKAQAQQEAQRGLWDKILNHYDTLANQYMGYLHQAFANNQNLAERWADAAGKLAQYAQGRVSPQVQLQIEKHNAALDQLSKSWLTQHPGNLDDATLATQMDLMRKNKDFADFLATGASPGDAAQLIRAINGKTPEEAAKIVAAQQAHFAALGQANPNNNPLNAFLLEAQQRGVQIDPTVAPAIEFFKTPRQQWLIAQARHLGIPVNENGDYSPAPLPDITRILNGGGAAGAGQSQAPAMPNPAFSIGSGGPAGNPGLNLVNPASFAGTIHDSTGRTYAIPTGTGPSLMGGGGGLAGADPRDIATMEAANADPHSHIIPQNQYSFLKSIADKMQAQTQAEQAAQVGQQAVNAAAANTAVNGAIGVGINPFPAPRMSSADATPQPGLAQAGMVPAQPGAPGVPNQGVSATTRDAWLSQLENSIRANDANKAKFAAMFQTTGGVEAGVQSIIASSGTPQGAVLHNIPEDRQKILSIAQRMGVFGDPNSMVTGTIPGTNRPTVPYSMPTTVPTAGPQATINAGVMGPGSGFTGAPAPANQSIYNPNGGSTFNSGT